MDIKHNYVLFYMSRGVIICNSDFISDKLINKTKVINLSDYIVISNEIKHKIMDL